MTDSDVRRLVAAVTDSWRDDLGSEVVWAGDHEGRRGVRMRQTVRDYTTVWFSVGDLTLTVEAFVLPDPPSGREELFRQSLRRNAGTRRVHFALDPQGDLVLRSRMPVIEVSPEELGMVLGEVHDLIEVSFPALIRTAFGRETNG